jgi:hypothetical protein
MPFVRFRRSGAFAHPNPRLPHLQVGETNRVQEVDAEMAARCTDFGWADPPHDPEPEPVDAVADGVARYEGEPAPAEPTPAEPAPAEPAPVEVAEPEDKRERKRREKHSPLE